MLHYVAAPLLLVLAPTAAIAVETPVSQEIAETKAFTKWALGLSVLLREIPQLMTPAKIAIRDLGNINAHSIARIDSDILPAVRDVATKLDTKRARISNYVAFAGSSPELSKRAAELKSGALTHLDRSRQLVADLERFYTAIARQDDAAFKELLPRITSAALVFLDGEKLTVAIEQSIMNPAEPSYHTTSILLAIHDGRRSIAAAAMKLQPPSTEALELERIAASALVAMAKGREAIATENKEFGQIGNSRDRKIMTQFNNLAEKQLALAPALANNLSGAASVLRSTVSIHDLRSKHLAPLTALEANFLDIGREQLRLTASLR